MDLMNITDEEFAELKARTIERVTMQVVAGKIEQAAAEHTGVVLTEDEVQAVASAMRAEEARGA